MKQMLCRVRVGKQIASLIYEHEGTHHSIYVDSLLSLLEFDEENTEKLPEPELEAIVSDIRNEKVRVWRYDFFPKSIYDFKVIDSKSWRDYPRPTSLSKAIARVVGPKVDLGYMKVVD